MRSFTAEDIMLTEVVTAAPDDALAMARLKMMRHGVGGLPVVERGRLVGIVTHRDVTLVGERESGLKVRDIMTSEVLIVTRQTPLRDILLIMKKTGYQRLPVVDDGRLIGLVTQSCVISALAERVE